MQKTTKGKRTIIKATIGELLELVKKDRTPKVKFKMIDPIGRTCFTGGLAKKLGLDPDAGEGWDVQSALNAVKIPIPAGIPNYGDGKLGIGDVAMRGNDGTSLSKRAIASKILSVLTEKALSRVVKIQVEA